MSLSARIRTLFLFLAVMASLPSWSQNSASQAPANENASLAAPQHVRDITSTFTLPEEEFRPKGSELKLSLNEAIDIALELNPQVRSSEHGLESSLANLDYTESAYRDTFDLNASNTPIIRETFRHTANKRGYMSNENNTLFRIGPEYARTFRNGSNVRVNPEIQYQNDSDAPFNGDHADDYYAINLSLNIPINSKPREQIRTDIENAKLSTIQSDYSLYMRKKSTTDQVINSYWSIKSLELNVDIQKERLLQARMLEFISKVKLDNEQVSELDYGKAQVDVLNQEATLISTVGRLRTSIERFNILLGMPVDTQLILPDELLVNPLPISADKYVEMVTSTNLELENIRLSIRKAENSLRIARLGQQPNFTLTNFFNRDDEGNQEFGAGLIFNWNFGDGGATKARVRALQHDLEQQKINLWNTERSLVQDTYADLRDLLLERQRIDILIKNVDQAARTFDNALFKYTNFGESTFLEMQDFQNNLARNRSDLVSAKVSYNIAMSGLMSKVHEYKPTDKVEPLLSILDR
ncbi:MAG: TolC family protein [Candidatus Omnitrophota bacterium]